MLRRLFAAFSLLLVGFDAAVHARAANAPLTLPDVLAWKRIQTPIASNDGQWFAYKLVPNDGDAQVIVRRLPDGKDQEYAIGEVPRANPYAGGGLPAGPPHDIAFSDDSKWVAFEVHPKQREARLLKKQHKPFETKVMAVELATGKKVEFERVKRFTFSGEASAALAIQRLPATQSGPGGSGGAAAGGSADGAAEKADDKPQGSDLIVVDLASGNQLDFGNVSEFNFDKHGNWLAWLVDAPDKIGNGIELRNMRTGEVMSLDSAKATYKSLNWTEKGDALAALRGIEDKKWEDKIYSLVAFKDLSGGKSPKALVFDPAKDKSFPEDMGISPDRKPAWMADLSEVSFGIRELRTKEHETEKEPDGKNPGSPSKSNDAKDAKEDQPDLVIWHWKDSRLQPMQQTQEARDKAFSFLCVWRPQDGKFLRLADPDVREVSVVPEYAYGIGTDVRQYELESNLDGKRFSDIYRVDLATGQRKLVLQKARWVNGASPDGKKFLYYQDGAFFSYDLASGESHNLTKQIAANFYDEDDDHNVTKPPTRPLGWSADSKYVLLTDKWDIWEAPTNGSAPVNLTANGKKEKTRYESIWRLDPDDKGFDLSKPLYVRAYGEWTKKGGIGVIKPGQPGIRMLHWDDASYVSLIKAKNADTYLYSRETIQHYPDFYLAGSDLNDGKKVSDVDSQQQAFAWTPGAKLVDYTGIKGDKLQGTLYLPASYEAGKKYPTIVYIYEKLSQGTNTYPQPGFNGFSVGYYTSNGYAVLTPDITYKVNDPGVSSIACILAALKAAEATGVVDPERVALHGHSWGGYQTAFAVTQTKAFRAAIAGAPLTDMVSMYSSVYWNTGSANQPIFESSQGRFAGGYWDNMQPYLRNSPVYHATNVQTPLLILCNDKDGAVDHMQGIEYFNTLRRLGKPVVMLEYKGENHGLIKPEDMKDYTVRMKEFFDYWLMDKPAPRWWTVGVPRLKMKDELDARRKQLDKAASDKTIAPTPTIE